MNSAKPLFVASWVTLLLLSLALLVGSLGSLAIAFSRTSQDDITPALTAARISEIGGEEAVKALKGRRATAATWALACALLSGWVVLIPYRRGARWAWWALLLTIGLSQLASLARALFISITLGTGTSGVILAFLLLGLLAGAPRMFSQDGLEKL